MATTNLSNHKIDDTTDMEALRAKLLENNPHLAPEEIANTPEAKGIQESTRAKSRRLKKEEVARNISEIPQSEQTAGILGINTKVAFHELPEGMKVIELTYASQNNKKIETLLNRLDITRPLNTTKAPITNSQDAPTVQGKVMTSFHVVPAEANAHALVQYFQEKNIPAHILLYEASSVPVIRINEEIRPIHPLIAQEKIEKISAKRLDIIRKDGSRANNVNQAETQKIKKFSATHATESSVHHSQSTPEIINERGCTFLIIDINALADDPEAIYGLMEVTSRLSTSQDFQFTTDQDGNLVIIALAERAGGVLGGRWAKSIEIATEGKVNMYIGYGKTQKTEESIVIDNYPQKEQREEWQKSAPGTYSDKEQSEKLRSTRNTTFFTLEFDESEGGTLSRVVGTEGEKSEKVNMVGRENEIKRLRTLTSQENQTRLILANGVAGVGKTTIIEELIEEQPNAIFVKMDSNGENLPGAALIQFAETIAQVVDQRVDQKTKDQYSGILSQLNDFVNKSISEKLDDAGSDFSALTIKGICVDVLKMLETVQGSFTLAIDDTHHIDRHSDQHIMNLVYEFLERTESKVMLIQRHEERYRSIAQKQLIPRIESLKGGKSSCSRSKNKDRRGTFLSRIQKMMGNDFKETSGTQEENSNVGTVKIDGLNFQDPEIAKPYAKRFIPKELLIDESTGQEREIGDWILMLAEGTDLPIDMDDRLMQLAENPKNFFIEGNTVHARKETIERILKEIKSTGDLGILLANRVESLTPSMKLAFQCLAVINRPLSAGDLATLVRTIQERSSEETSTPFSISELLNNEQIVTSDGSSAKTVSPGTPLKIRHELLEKAVITNMTNEERYRIGNFLFLEFEGRADSLHSDEKFALLHLGSTGRTTEAAHTNFWKAYETQAAASIKEAEETNSHRRAHQIASTILGAAGKETVIKEEIAKMTEGKSAASESVKSLVVLAITTTLKTSTELGRHKETLRCLETIETLHEACPELSINMTEVYKQAFKSANSINQNEKLTEITKKLQELGTLTPREEFMIDMRIAYKIALNLNNFTIYNETLKRHEEIFREIRAESGEAYAEYARLNARAILEKTTAEIRESKIDEDATVEPGLLTEETTARLLFNRSLLEIFKNQQRENTNKFSSADELSLLELAGQTSAQLGLYDQAAEDLGEAWRIAMQMGDNHQAARIAKIKCECELLRASLLISYPTIVKSPIGLQSIPGKITKVREKRDLDRTLIKRSIQTITEMGLSLVDDESGLERKSNAHVFMRIQRLGAISLLLDSYDDFINKPQEELYQVEGMSRLEEDEIKNEIGRYIQVAIEDLNTLKGLTDEMPGLKRMIEGEDGTYAYYIVPFATHIADSASKLGISTDDLQMDSILFKPEIIENGITHGKSRRPDNMNANQKKQQLLETSTETFQKIAA